MYRVNVLEFRVTIVLLETKYTEMCVHKISCINDDNGVCNM